MIEDGSYDGIRLADFLILQDKVCVDGNRPSRVQELLQYGNLSANVKGVDDSVVFRYAYPDVSV